MIATHYQIDFSEHYLADYMATRGIGFLGWNTRFRGFESSFLLDHALVDIGVGVRWLREVQGVETVVLLGNSGGGSLMAAYQAQAVDPHVTPLEGMRPGGGPHRAARRRRLRRQRGPPRPPRRADRLDGRRRSSTKTTRWQPIPSSTCSTRRTGRRSTPSSSPATASAQIARNHAITDWAETRTQTGARRRLLRPAVHRDAHLGRPAHGRPHARTHQAPAQHVLRGRPGQGQPVRARHRRGLHAAQLARHVEPAARADPRRTAPGPHHLPGTGDQRRAGHRCVSLGRPAHLSTHWPAPTRRSASIDTDHYFTTPGARSEKADTIAKWIAKRWR